MRTLRKLNILGAIAALLSTTLLLGSCVSDDDNNPVNPTADRFGHIHRQPHKRNR